MTSQNNLSIEEISTFIRQNLLKKGYDNLRILGKNFREMPSYDGFNKVNRDEFLVVLRDLGILLPKDFSEKLIHHYDMDIDGCVNFEDFLYGIRGKPNDKRQQVVNEVFQKFDVTNQGFINIRDLKGVFNASNHPKVLNGDLNQEQIFNNFLKHFNDRGEGFIEKHEWDDFYAAVSFIMENDDHFIFLLKSEWQLD